MSELLHLPHREHRDALGLRQHFLETLRLRPAQEEDVAGGEGREVWQQFHREGPAIGDLVLQRLLQHRGGGFIGQNAHDNRRVGRGHRRGGPLDELGKIVEEAGFNLVSQGEVIRGWRLGHPSALSLLMLAPIGGVAVASLITALVGWPYGWDPMNYHLPRVAHWQQDRSLGFYPTHITHQLFYPPWAEQAILHLRLLGPDERTANLVAWASLLLALGGVSLVARELGATRRGQLFAANKSSSRFYGPPLVAWKPALGAFQYEVQWGHKASPFVATGGLKTPTSSTSTVLPLGPGVWYYRVRGVNAFIPGAKPLMSWSDPTRLVVTRPSFRVVH